MYRFFLTAALICTGCLPATEAQTLIDLVPGPEGSFPADFAHIGRLLRPPLLWPKSELKT